MLSTTNAGPCHEFNRRIHFNISGRWLTIRVSAFKKSFMPSSFRDRPITTTNAGSNECQQIKAIFHCSTPRRTVQHDIDVIAVNPGSFHDKWHNSVPTLIECQVFYCFLVLFFQSPK
jgi:hypothetical protein